MFTDLEIVEIYKKLLEESNDIIFEWQLSTDTITFSKNFEKKLGYNFATGKLSELLSTSTHISPSTLPKINEVLEKIKHNKKHDTLFNFKIKNSAGSYLWFKARLIQEYTASSDTLPTILGLLMDITEEKRIEEKLLEASRRDALTGMYNKTCTNEVINETLSQLKPDSYAALLILDVDDFKSINDNLGHHLGDAFLKDVSALIKSQFTENFILGRIGGDEFVIFLYNLVSIDIAAQKADTILKLFQSIKVPKLGSINCSIGISVTSSSNDTYNTLLLKADQALYKAKNTTKNCFVIFDPSDTYYTSDIKSVKTSSTTHSNKNNNGISPSSQTEIPDAVKEAELIASIYRLFYKASSIKEVEHSLSTALKLLGEYFNVSRAYIFELDLDPSTCSNRYEWCNTGIPSKMHERQNISFKEDLNGTYLSLFDETYVFYCRDITQLHPSHYKFFNNSGAKSVLQYAIFNYGKFCGFMGFDECHENVFWSNHQIHTLVHSAAILGTFILKLKSEKKCIELENLLNSK